MNKTIQVPLSEEDINTLKAGDYVYLSGIIYTARDAAHKRMYESMHKGESLPIELNGNVLYYLGPSPARALARSRMLSSDVSAAYDPAYAEAFEKKNCAYFGKGMVINKYTGARGKSGSNDANAEYLARLRRIFDDNKVAFQTAELGKVDYGGGGTIAYIAALYGMEVVDSGVAVLSMHAPWEIISKSDLYEAKKGYVAVLKNA